MTELFEVRLMVAKLEGVITGIIYPMDQEKYPTEVLKEQLVLIKEIAEKLKEMDNE